MPVDDVGSRDGGLTGAQFLGRPELWVFVILLGSYAFFWHSRDWNTASRLMLTYALVDRGTIAITGLEQQTNDQGPVSGPVLFRQAAGFFVAGGAAVCDRQGCFRSPGPPAQRRRHSHTGRPTTGSPWAPPAC